MYQAQKVWLIGLTEACSAAGTMCIAQGSGQLSLDSLDIQLLYKLKELCGSGSVSSSTNTDNSSDSKCAQGAATPMLNGSSATVENRHQNRQKERSYQQIGTGAHRKFTYKVDSLQLVRSVYTLCWRSYILAKRNSSSLDVNSVSKEDNKSAERVSYRLDKHSSSRKWWIASAQVAFDSLMRYQAQPNTTPWWDERIQKHRDWWQPGEQQCAVSLDREKKQLIAYRWLELASASESMRANRLSGVVDAIGRFSCELKKPESSTHSYSKKLPTRAAAQERTNKSSKELSSAALVCDLGGILWLHLNTSRLVSNSYAVIWSNTALDYIASSAMSSNNSGGRAGWLADVTITSDRPQSIAECLGWSLIESSSSLDQSQAVRKELCLSVCGRVSDSMLKTRKKGLQLRWLPRVEKIPATRQSRIAVSDKAGELSRLGRCSLSRKTASLIISQVADWESMVPVVRSSEKSGISDKPRQAWRHGSVNRLKVLSNKAIESISKVNSKTQNELVAPSRSMTMTETQECGGRMVIASLPLLDLDRSVSLIDLVYRDSAYKQDVKKQWLPVSSVVQQQLAKKRVLARTPIELVNSRQPSGWAVDREWQMKAAYNSPLLGVIKNKEYRVWLKAVRRLRNML